MSKRDHDEHKLRQWQTIEGIRKRPAMYIGGTEFFGFIQYIVAAYDYLLEHGATWIEIELGESIKISSDSKISVHMNPHGELEPFEVIGNVETRHSHDAAIVTALSEKFHAVVSDGTKQAVLKYKSGKRELFEQKSAESPAPFVRLELVPDTLIFSVTEVSPAVIHSYSKRLSRLHPNILFRVRISGEETEYVSKKGIRDFFDDLSTPYQILHEPIHIFEEDGNLTVETVFVFHSWTENQIWSFANKGRVPDGGTHETGFLEAVAHIHTHSEYPAGLLAVLAIEYPEVAYEGCIKGRIGNPELRSRVSKLVSTGFEKWKLENEAEVKHIKTIERFQFAATW